MSPSAQRAFRGQIVTTADVDAIHSARHHIEAGREDNGIQWELRVAHNEALLGKSTEWAPPVNRRARHWAD